MIKIIFFLLISTLILYAQDTTIYNFDSGVGQTWTGWTYSTSADGYGSKGFYYTAGTDCGFEQPYAPQIFENEGYGSSNDFEIDTTDRAPSTSSGGCLLITEDGGTSNQCAIWIFKNCYPFGDTREPLTSGIDSTYDRLEFYVKNTGLNTLSRNGGPGDVESYTHHFGTYLCDGSDCPGEGPGNQHYYHQLVMSSGAWIKVQLNRHPEHLRGESGTANPGDNPGIAYGMHYFTALNRAYFEIRYDQDNETSMKIDEVVFTKTGNMAETNQNDESIGTMCIGYFSDRDEWEMNWYDVGYPDGMATGDFSTYEIRFSTSAITNSNYSSASVVTYVSSSYAGITYSGNSNYVRKPADDVESCFTRFTLPDTIESSYSKIYFAIKDVSSSGNNAGSEWPYTRTDGRDAPNNYIRTIDYDLSSGPAYTEEQGQAASQKKTDVSSVTEDSN